MRSSNNLDSSTTLTHSLYIDGKWIAPEASSPLHVIINPADEQPIASIAFGSEADIDKAIEAAHRAFPDWSQTPLVQRLEVAERICEVYEKRLPEIALAVTKEMGAPYHSLSMPVQAPVGLWHLQTAINEAKNFSFERELNATTTILREPIGVCGLITPWNWPLNQVVIKFAPALIAGCTVILKPSQNSPLSAHLLAEIIQESGVPAGVFNMIQGEGAKLGMRLASHPLVDMISVTGSNAAGAAASHAAADTIKRVSLELGGKSANIILEGADFPAAIPLAVQGLMANSGQSCNAPSRLLVPKSRLHEVELLAADAANAIKVGDPMAEDTAIGPIANKRQFDRVQNMIREGMRDPTAKLIAGGLDRPDGLNTGYYARPTVFSRVSNNSLIAREEIFGPVLVIIPYNDEDHAIEIANDTIYGLSGYVWGATLQDAERVARKLRTGMVHINGAGLDFSAPFGGYKQSGNGREWGLWGLEDFLETKAMMRPGS